MFLFRLGLFRDAEKQFASALKQHKSIDIYLFLSKVYAKLDLPLNSISKLKEANEVFPFEITILQEMARIHEVTTVYITATATTIVQKNMIIQLHVRAWET